MWSISNFKTKTWRSEKYLDYIRGLACCRCGIELERVDPHHICGEGFNKGTSSKISDILVIPLCRSCHDFTHREKGSVPQLYYLGRTIEKAADLGIIGYTGK